MLSKDWGNKIFYAHVAGIIASAIPTPLFSGCVLTATQLYVLIRLLKLQINLRNSLVLVSIFIYSSLGLDAWNGCIKAGDTAYITGISILILNLYLLHGSLEYKTEVNIGSGNKRKLLRKSYICIFLLGVVIPIAVAFWA